MGFINGPRSKWRMNMNTAVMERPAVATQTQDFTYYKAVLGGKEDIQVFADEPKAGYYRDGSGPKAKAIAIKIMPDGKALVKVDGKAVTSRITDIWLNCAHRPVEFSVYQSRVKTGVWPVDQARVDERKKIQDRMSEFVTKMTKLHKKAAKNGPADQNDADILAGYVQQGRALLKEVDEVRATVKAPVDKKVAEIKEEFDDPMKSIKAMNSKFLDLLATFGSEKMKAANDPKYKWNAGKSGVGNTISLRKAEKIEVTDMEKLIGEFGNEPDVEAAIKEAVTAAQQKAVTAMAIKEYKATGQLPKGLSAETVYTAQ